MNGAGTRPTLAPEQWRPLAERLRLRYRLVVLGATWLGSGAAAEATGEILVVDPNAGTEGRGALLVASPTSGPAG